MKDELSRKIMAEFAAMKANVFSYVADDEDNKKVKGTRTCVIKQKLEFKDYKNKINYPENCIQADGVREIIKI